MKKVIIITVCMFMLSSCSPKTPDIGNNNSSSQNSVNTSSIAEEVSVVDTKMKEFLLIQSDNLSSRDFETIYAMCKQALTEYAQAHFAGGTIDFSQYIENKNLLKYMEERLKVERYENTFMVSRCTFGLIDIEWTYAGGVSEGRYEKDYVMLHISCLIGGTHGESAYMLVSHHNDKLVIEDWYAGGKDRFDTYYRNDIQLNNGFVDLNFWNNETKANAVFEEIIKNKDRDMGFMY